MILELLYNVTLKMSLNLDGTLACDGGSQTGIRRSRGSHEIMARAGNKIKEFSKLCSTLKNYTVYPFSPLELIQILKILLVGVQCSQLTDMEPMTRGYKEVFLHGNNQKNFETTGV